MKSTKKSLLSSMVALVLCISMLLGTTFAWFTDEVTSAGNKIESGTLKVDLELLDPESGKWTSLKDSKAPIFDYDKWEPGYVNATVLKVENEGTLALRWVARFESEKALSALKNVIDVYVRPSSTPIEYPEGRDLAGYSCVGTLGEFINTIEDTTYGTLEAGGVSYLGIALKMREDAGNEYQGLSLGGAFDIRILATQWTGALENDSFDNQYDKDATHPALVTDLELSADVSGKVENGKLTEAVSFTDVSGITATVPAGTAVEGNKLTLKITDDKVNGAITLATCVGYDVYVEGVAEGNTAPIIITMPRALPMEQTAVQLYHDGVMMARVPTIAALSEKEGNNDSYGDKFLYDPATGDVSFSLTHFSNVSMASTTSVVVHGKEIVGIEIDLSSPGEYLADGKITIPADGNVYIVSHTRTDTTTKNALDLTLMHTWHNINPGEMSATPIKVERGAKVVLSGVNIRTSASVDALEIIPASGGRNQGSKTYIYIADGTNNWLTGKSGIGFASNPAADVFVEGGGCLYATAMGWGSPGIGVDAHSDGYNSNRMHFKVAFLRAIPRQTAAGIGGGFAGQSWAGLGLVEINGGTYQVYRGGDAASIGSGLNGEFGEIVINAGTVYCYTNPWTAYSRDMGRGMYAGSCRGIYVSKDATVYGYSFKTGYGPWKPGEGYVPSGMSQDASVVVNGFEPMAGTMVVHTSADAGKLPLYTVGQTVSIEGITVNYRDVEPQLKTSGYTLGAVDMTTGGRKTVTVTYKENGSTITGSFEIMVTDEFNAITAAPKKTIYEVGYELSVNDFIVNAIASDGSLGTASGYAISEVDMSTVGIKQVTISYVNPTTGKMTSTVCQIDVIKTSAPDVEHKQYWFDPFQFYLGDSTPHNYKQYTPSGKDAFADSVNYPYLGDYVGVNGEKATDFFNYFGDCVHVSTDPSVVSPSGWYTVMGAGQYGLTITDALPWTTVGAGFITGYDDHVIGVGYYVDGDLSTLRYNAPSYFKELVKVDANYQGFIDQYGEEGIIANTKLSLSSFAEGSTHTVTWIVIFDDGIQKVTDWTITMASSFGSDSYFQDTTKPNVNAIVLSGQSNAAGATPITQDMINKFGSVDYKNVYIKYCNDYLNPNNGYALENWNQNDGFEKYTFGISGYYDKTTVGPEAALAYHLATEPGLKDQQWFIIKYTAPGTNLDLHWMQGQKIADAMMNYVEGCLEDLAKDYDVQLRSLLWMQGENDALAESCADNYATNEQNLVSAFRRRFAAYASRPNGSVSGSGISFITAGIAPAGKDGNQWIYSATVNAAKVSNSAIWYVPGTLTEQSALYGIVQGPGMHVNSINGGAIYNSAYIDTSLMSGQAADPAHYDQTSIEWLGTWFGQYVAALITLYG